MNYLVAVCLALSVSMFGCGGSDAPAADADISNPIGCEGTERYWALTPASTWTFKITDPSDSTKLSEKTQRINTLEQVPGKPGVQAYKVVTTKPGGDVTSWQEDTGDSIRRHREEDRAGTNHADDVYDPYKLRIDETSAHVMVGASWMESYDEIITDVTGGTGTTTQTKTETWTVQAVDEIVSVPAGAFCALRVRKVSIATAGSSDKTYWFTRGVGKVKEESATQREELVSYSIP